MASLKIPFKAFECTSKVFECPFKSLGWTYKGFCAYNDSRFLLQDHRDRYLGSLFRVDKLKLTCTCDS